MGQALRGLVLELEVTQSRDQGLIGFKGADAVCRNFVDVGPQLRPTLRDRGLNEAQSRPDLSGPLNKHRVEVRT